MSQKPVPEFMRRYMENTGYESYAEYDLLSREYHSELSHYHENVYPRKVEMDSLYRRATGAKSTFNGKRDLHDIDERYKARALDVACKYGYDSPDERHIDHDLTDVQESRETFGKHLEQNDFGLSVEDVRANRAHKNFEEKNKVSVEEQKHERHFIDFYYGERRNENMAPTSKRENRYIESLSSEKVKSSVDKEEVNQRSDRQPDRARFEDKLQEFNLEKENVTSPKSDKDIESFEGDRFSKTLSSERVNKDTFDTHQNTYNHPSKDSREDVDLER